MDFEKIVTKNFRETQKLGEEFAKKLLPGDTILLFGDLGAGKTTFVQGLAKGLGIERRIISPTFIIIRKYTEKFYHVDLYRTGSENDLEGLGLKEILNDKDAITAIEWPEKLGSYTPKKRWEVRFRDLGEDKREIYIDKLT